MNSTKVQFIVGIFFIAGLLAVAFLAVRIGGGHLFPGDTYTLSARFTNVGGLKAGSSVNLLGVTVGSVKDVEIKVDDMVAVVTFQISSDIKLDMDTIASIKTTGLIGEKFLALEPGGSDIYLEPGDMIVDTSSAIDLEDLISRFAFGSIEE